MSDNKKYKEELIKRSFNLARETMKLIDSFPQKRSAWVISDQLIRCITSIGANITEAQAASSKRDFIKFLTYALKSSNEGKFWLGLSKDLDEKLISQIDILFKETEELSNILRSSLIKLKGKNKF